MASISNEQYQKIRTHLHLISFEEAYANETEEVRKDMEDNHKYFPCYKFDPKSLNEGVDFYSPDFIDPMVFLGRRNPWNCAQLAVTFCPQILDRI